MPRTMKAGKSRDFCWAAIALAIYPMVMDKFLIIPLSMYTLAPGINMLSIPGPMLSL